MANRAIAASDTKALLSTLIARIDALVSEQLDNIIHHPRFQQLEAAWRGLHLLVYETPRKRRTKIVLLNVSWSEITRDMERSLEWDQSLLFHKLHTSEFDMPGGEPYGVVICNYRISHRNASDLRTLKRMAAVAQASFCTLLFPAHPELFGMDSFRDLHPSLSPRRLFREDEYRLWGLLRKDPASRFMAFLLPGILLRKPWGLDSVRRARFPYREQCRYHEDFLWGHPGFILARILLREFEEVGWFAHIRGAPRDTLAGGIVSGVLPEITVDSTDPLVSVLPSTQISITDSMERKLSECGLVSLSHCWQTPFSAFFSLPSLHEPELSKDSRDNDNQRIASQVQNILCASRFAHYIKVLMREKVGSYTTAEDCQAFLQDWLTEYSTGGDNLNWVTKARYPLRHIDVRVRDKPMSPGHYLCDIQLAPHYQYDGLVGEVKLTTEIARGAA